MSEQEKLEPPIFKCGCGYVGNFATHAKPGGGWCNSLAVLAPEPQTAPETEILALLREVWDHYTNPKGEAMAAMTYAALHGQTGSDAQRVKFKSLSGRVRAALSGERPAAPTQTQCNECPHHHAHHAKEEALKDLVGEMEKLFGEMVGALHDKAGERPAPKEGQD